MAVKPHLDLNLIHRGQRQCITTTLKNKTKKNNIMKTMTSEEKEILMELFPFITIKEENHRLGTILEIQNYESLRYKKNYQTYDWVHAGKYKPCLFTLVFSRFTKNAEIEIDNYCNIIEEGDCSYDRGECTLIISDKKEITEIYDLL